MGHGIQEPCHEKTCIVHNANNNGAETYAQPSSIISTFPSYQDNITHWNWFLSLKFGVSN